MITDLALRYGNSLYDTAKAQGQEEKTLLELRLVRTVCETSPEVREFLFSRAVPATAKQEILDKNLNGKISATTLSFLGVLAENSRFEHLENIVSAYEQIIDSNHGICRGTVQSAAPLTTEERKKVENQIQAAIGKKVILSFEEDASLMGGMVAQVGGWTFDDSIKSHLKKLGDNLNKENLKTDYINTDKVNTDVNREDLNRRPR